MSAGLLQHPGILSALVKLGFLDLEWGLAWLQILSFPLKNQSVYLSGCLTVFPLRISLSSDIQQGSEFSHGNLVVTIGSS